MTPRATYRLQFNKDFGFDDAARVAPYLAQLGVSHIYASPWLKPRAGSSHGYDIVDHRSLNYELGDEAAFNRMVEVLKKNGLRPILDMVPNHMGVGGADNPLWLDVLEWGSESAYAGWFDIDWQPDHSYLRGKLLVPFLGNQYGTELAAGKLSLKFDAEDGSFAIWAYDVHKLPVCPLHYNRILGDAHPDLERLGDAFSHLNDWRPQAGRRARELKSELASLAKSRDDVRDGIASASAQFEGTPGDGESWNRLRELIQDQHWRAAHFRVAADDINYRRFFDINDLAGLRMELADVFDYAHALVFQLMKKGVLDGLRIDHVDGLLNPKQYFQKLRAASADSEPAYLIVEKILARHEHLREDWPVDGTTGYEFANLLLGLLIDPAGEEPFTQIYSDFTGARTNFADMVRDCKLRIMRNEMTSELHVLAREAAGVARQHPATADFTQNVLHRAIREVLACFPVYRIYIDPEGTPSEEDRRYLDWAMKRARANETEIDSSVFDFVHKILSGDLVSQSRSGFSRYAVLRCAMKLQQYSGAVMAKGLEDTAFYRYNRFVALNEVGGDPDQFGISISNFHKANTQRAKRWPSSLLCTSTHDTKRGEDVRARLAVLSEMPAEWAKQVQLWSRILRARRGDIQASAPPDRNDEYFLYQQLVGTWPMELVNGDDLDTAVLEQYRKRLKQSTIKAIREAKVHSSWASPNTAYEDAVLTFIENALDLLNSQSFLTAFLPFVRKLARLGVHNSLVQTVLKLTAPGVPDIYQGSELWDLSMVDPDNRRPVDYDARIQLLGFSNTAPEALLHHWQDGSVKLFTLSHILAFRSRERDLFAKGEYEPLTVTGPQADCVCAFTRRLGDRCAIVAVSLLPARLEAGPGWCETAIATPSCASGRRLKDVLTGAEIVPAETFAAEVMFGKLPVAVLEIS
jgi:(1->4)-alpha-D-glucan 1-alpha-D-glucosylmutase